ncbi:bifunctional homocysteine S-methyltransferase/methylenetetrahydrofolate reductase [Clostridium aminobutyricum]|uniref:Bifunctional homocysteine S-methyltransferase/methylenetetrahydrofolate reductase n=1 Tax=Clostridium aminobutyricum TaxID=33953 RepID=A0A939DB19_CLOAM|nr:bifunctional homocysteine S-methyltransferase/methylenetetrahydrofolate reductase [Clostridium aminobutyricum]MBN7774456.1 bifunctional homocysteine S-methyltransferase/methylenetetrahydrofolate reductase [Clostridium aminobutyricum]
MRLRETPLIFDGAMGTYYATISPNPLSRCELANLYERHTILDIHQQYIEAGCKAIRTNTFGANRVYLEGNADLVQEVISKGYEIALEAVKDKDVLVFADIGPIPASETVDARKEYIEIIDQFLALGATHFVFETFSEDRFLAELARYIKGRNSTTFVLAEFAVSPEGYTRLGESGRKLIERTLQEPAIDACGFNCFSGPYHLLQYIKTFNIKDKTISIMPNSGYPTIINNRTFFDNTKEYFAMQMLEIAKTGVSIIGGCCGTTPEFIREMVRKLKDLSPNQIVLHNQEEEKIVDRKSNKNSLLEKMKSGKKIIAVELDPPIDTEIDFFISSAKRLKEHQVDAITIADCPIARARVDSSLLACKLKRELDITPIPHMTCRDRNINATKALLLGLNIEGVNNVLVVTGDPVPSAQRDEIKSMFSFNSAVLANYIRNLNEGTFSSPFNICAALNVNARNFHNELAHAKKKIENGVSMFLTQPVLTKQAMENLKKAHQELDAFILGGIIPIVSYRNACFMNNEISGIKVSDEIIQMYEGVSKEEADRLAVELSVQIAKEIGDYVDGYYIITPFKRIDLVSKIIEEVKE